MSSPSTPPPEDRAGSLRAGQLSLFDAAGERAPEPAAAPTPDEAARRFAVDPRHHVVLEASAGTGKTSVLVQRYINLLKGGVEPANILAITFTRKAAAEMRERIVHDLREAAARGEIDKARWRDLRDRLGEIAISTIDAFCLSLLREFPLEADLDPGFDMADETEVPRLVDESLDRSLRTFIRLAAREPDVALVLAQLGTARTRAGLALLLERRLVAWNALDRFLVKGPADLTAALVCRRAATALEDVLRTATGGLRQFLADGPVSHPRYELLVRDIERLKHADAQSDASIRSAIERVAAHFLTAERKPRKSAARIVPYTADQYPSADAGRRHRQTVVQLGEAVARVIDAFDRDLNVLLARGIRRMFGIALAQYRETLEKRAVLDFSDVLQRALTLLRQMDEFSQSRFRLESRYHHVLVDEFQDTSRAQWELVSLLIQSWGEGAGLAASPSIFIVGDRKQSIYRFRDAEVAVLDEAGRYIEALRPGSAPRRAISRSFRAVPELLSFVNDLFAEVAQPTGRIDDFTYGESDRFPIDLTPETRRAPALGISAAETPELCAAAVAAEIARILAEDSVRDRKTGVPRKARPRDIAILFRSRASHREFERELELHGVPTYVYKGLGFFDADEIKDVSALMRFLANPVSELRAAAFLRSRVVRISDRGLAALAPGFSAALLDAEPPPAAADLGDEDRRVLLHVRAQLAAVLPLVDRVPPADLIEQLIPAFAYPYELRGARRLQAWENLKKMRGLVRRIQNRGYATMSRIADYIDALSAGDESNAVIEALDAVSLMTVHASKGLEFPIVFVVNVAKGASGPPHPVRVVDDAYSGEPSVSVGSFTSEVDEREREREKQETRRLLYVAVTRARDRLYLSSALKNGTMAPGPGSLGEALPPSIRDLFARAATAFPECATIAWSGQSGRTYEWLVCRGAQDPSAATAAAAVTAARPFVGHAAQPASGGRTSVTSAVGGTADTVAEFEASAGRLVHRLFQFAGVAPSSGDRRAIEAFARGLLRADERAAIADVDALVRIAVDAWESIRRQPAVAALLASGERHFEVPFSAASAGDPSSVVRGTIDCLIERGDGTIVVVEFKTGAARGSHEQQLAMYVDAARRVFPDRVVEGRLIYG
jgi:ATP-dependent helicase/nuclease subunit A